MLIWISLSLIVIAISLVLALRSMRSFKAFPAKTGVDYALFLIKKEDAVNIDFLTQFYTNSQKEYPELIISLERLFKGTQKALVIFAPKALITPFTHSLGLLELEDYSLKDYGQFLAWNMGSKDQNTSLEKSFPSMTVIPELASSEQVWWQVVFQLTKSLNAMQARTNTRVIAWGESNKTVQVLQDNLSKVGETLLLPDPVTSETKLRLYRERAFALDISSKLMEIK